jgi:hypothetical protein
MLLALVALAQYPLAPTPVLDTRTFTREVRLGGYVGVRGVLRRDTLTFVVNRARVTAQALPAPFAALRFQVDYTATGRTSGDTVPAIVLTDAYVLLVPPSPDSVGRLHPALVVGQFRTPFSLEFLTSFSLLPVPSRSQPVDRLSTRRDIGVLGQVAVGRAVTVTAALVNGEGPNRLVNADGREMAIGRVTVLPLPNLQVSAKYLGHGADHRWGYDARWLGNGAVVEGEYLARRGPFGPGEDIDAGGGYALAAYKIRPWLQPVVKWEHLRDSRTIGPTTTERRLTYTTVGVNLLSRGETIRVLFNAIYKSEPPLFTGTELAAQIIAIF